MSKNRLPPITKKFTDESTAKKFQFTFYCDGCGIGRQSPAQPFSAANMVTGFGSMTKAQRLIYDAEYDDAYEQANREAIGYFFACTDCGKYICEDCILPSSPSDIFCSGCMEKRKANKNDELEGGNDNGK